MGRGTVYLYLLLFLISLVILPYSDKGFAANDRRFFEVGLGGGIDLVGLDTSLALLAPAVSMPIKGTDMLRFRLEGNLEFIEHRGQVTTIGGIAPFLRATWQKAGIRPFAEIGGGINYSSRKKVDGKELTGPFLFSAMGGVGVEFQCKKKPVSVSYRLRHLSNAHLYKGNQGFNSQYLMLSIGF